MKLARWTAAPAGGAYHVSGTKNGIGYTVPLSPLALAEIGAVWPEEEPTPDHRLLGRLAGSGFKGFGKLKARVDAPPKVTGWRWHDLRRTARTGMTRLGVPRDHAEAAINHVSGRSALERTYDRHDHKTEIVTALFDVAGARGRSGHWFAPVGGQAVSTRGKRRTVGAFPWRGARCQPEVIWGFGNAGAYLLSSSF